MLVVCGGSAGLVGEWEVVEDVLAGWGRRTGGPGTDGGFIGSIAGQQDNL